MHTFTFRIDKITWHLDGQKVLTLTELPTRIGAKFHPDPLHRMASIQISTFVGDLNQYQLGQIVEMKMLIVTVDGESVRETVANPDDLMMPFVSDSSLMRGPVIVDFVPMTEDFTHSVPTADDWPMSISSNGICDGSRMAH